MDLLSNLEARVLAMIEAVDQLKDDPKYEFYMSAESDVDEFEKAVEKLVEKVKQEIKELQSESSELVDEITDLSGEELLSD